jgi:hypothetical protein
MKADCYLTLVQSEDAPAVARALRSSLEALGFQPYDPFPGGSSPPALWEQTVKAFVEPARDGWVRVLGKLRAEALSSASAMLDTPLLHLWLTGEMWGYLLFVEGADAMDEEALGSLLRPGRSLDDLRRAMAGELGTVPLDPVSWVEGEDGALPDEVKRLAEGRGVDTSKAQRMIDRWADGLFSRLDKESGGQATPMRAQADHALEAAPCLWSTPAGQRMRAFAACLALPPEWHSPTLDEVRGAYMVARRKAHRPGAALLPGEETALARLPNAVSYLPLYFGMASK